MTADYPRRRGVRPPTDDHAWDEALRANHDTITAWGREAATEYRRRSRLARWSRLWPALYAIAAYTALTAAYVAVLAWLFTVID